MGLPTGQGAGPTHRRSGSTCHKEALSRSFFTSSSVRRYHCFSCKLSPKEPPLTRLSDQELEHHTAEQTSEGFQPSRRGVANPATANRDPQRDRIGALWDRHLDSGQRLPTPRSATPTGRHGHRQRAVERASPPNALHREPWRWPMRGYCAGGRVGPESATTSCSAAERWRRRGRGATSKSCVDQKHSPLSRSSI